jgi:hypothetical protein
MMRGGDWNAPVVIPYLPIYIRSRAEFPSQVALLVLSVSAWLGTAERRIDARLHHAYT